MLFQRVSPVTSIAVVAVILTAICGTLCGCRGGGEKSEEIRIKFWLFPMWMGLRGDEKTGTPEDWPRLQIKRFEAAHPGVKIDLEMLNYQSGGQKLDLAVLSGTYPDISYRQAERFKKYVDQGVLEPIDDYLTPEDYTDVYPEVMALSKYKGKTYLWPWWYNTIVVALNRDIFRERGVEHLIPSDSRRSWTYDQFLKACKACTFDRDGDGRTDVYGYGLYGIPTSNEYTMLGLILGFGGKLFNEDGTRFTLNSPDSMRGLQFLLDLQDKYKVVPPGAAGYQSGQIGQMWLNQEIAMMSTGSSVVKSVQISALRGGYKMFHFVVVQPPHLPGRPPSTKLDPGGYMVFKQKDKRKKDMVMAFARFLTTGENAGCMRYTGSLPGRRLAGDIYAGEPDSQVGVKLRPVGHIYYTNPNPEIWPVIANMYQRVFTGALTPEQALAQADKEANAIIAREPEESGPYERK